MSNTIPRMLLDKTLKLIAVIFVLETVRFAFFYLLPGDPTVFFYGKHHFSSQMAEEVIRHFNLDMPIYVQYVTFLINDFTGNWGMSWGYLTGVPISDFIWRYAGKTITIFTIAALSSIGIALLGVRIFQRRKLKPARPFSGALALCAFAMPAFLVALMEILIFAKLAPSWPFAGSEVDNFRDLDGFGQIVDLLQHAFLPVTALVISNTGGIYLLYKRTSFSKSESAKGLPCDGGGYGLKESTLAFARGLASERYAMLLFFSWIMSQLIVIEYIFGYKGLGYLLWEGIITFDYQLVGACMFLILMILLIAWFVFDVLVSVTAALKAEESARPATSMQLGEAGIDSRPPNWIDLNPNTASEGAPSFLGWLKDLSSLFFKDAVGMAALFLLLFFAVIAVIGPFIAPENPLNATYWNGGGYGLPSQPDGAHLLGTDFQHKDVLSQMLYGAMEPVLVTIAVTFIAIPMGMAFGIIAARFGRIADSIVMVLANAMIAMPFFMLMMLSCMTFGKVQLITILIMVTSWWAIIAIAVRNKMMSKRELFFQPGGRRLNDMMRTVIPQLAPSVLRISKFLVPISVLSVMMLEFFGLGEPRGVTWGWILERAHSCGAMLNDWWWWIVPPVVAMAMFSGSLYLLFERLEWKAKSLWGKDGRYMQNAPPLTDEDVSRLSMPLK